MFKLTKLLQAHFIATPWNDTQVPCSRNAPPFFWKPLVAQIAKLFNSWARLINPRKTAVASVLTRNRPPTPSSSGTPVGIKLTLLITFLKLHLLAVWIHFLTFRVNPFRPLTNRKWGVPGLRTQGNRDLPTTWTTLLFVPLTAITITLPGVLLLTTLPPRVRTADKGSLVMYNRNTAPKTAPTQARPRRTRP